jgi:hypothetical protein
LTAYLWILEVNFQNQKSCVDECELQLPQPFERLQNPFDLLAAFFVLPAEVGGEGFGVRSGDLMVVVADELADDGDLLG